MITTVVAMLVLLALSAGFGKFPKSPEEVAPELVLPGRMTYAGSAGGLLSHEHSSPTMLARRSSRRETARWPTNWRHASKTFATTTASRRAKRCRHVATAASIDRTPTCTLNGEPPIVAFPTRTESSYSPDSP